MQIKIKASMNEIDNLWSVYTMTDDEIEFVGHCKLVDVLKTPDVRGIPQFENGKQYTVEVITIHNNGAEARIAASKLTTQLNRPKLNQSMALTRHCPIQCVESGQQWNNAIECARQQGIAASALSNHLNNKPGHRTIRGLTYRRVPLKKANLVREAEEMPTLPWVATANPMTGETVIWQGVSQSKNVVATGSNEKTVAATVHGWLLSNGFVDKAHAVACDKGLY